MTICPCCGSPIAGATPSKDLKEAENLTPQQKTLVAELVRVYPRYASLTHLVDHLYALDPRGGPDNPENVIRTCMSRLRRALVGFGWTVSKAQTGPGSHSKYRLEPLA